MLFGAVLLILSAITALGTYRAKAAIINRNCIIQNLGVQSANNPNGYNYRTIKVTQPGSSSNLGNTMRGDCQLTYANLAHNWAGQTRHADAVWEGTRSSNPAYNPTIDGGYNCTLQAASLAIGVDHTGPGGRSCSASGTGTYWVFQDDASAVSIEGNMVYCVAISIICPTPSIYANGVEPNPSAYRGAGYNQPGASPNLTGLFNKTSNPNSPTIGLGYLDNTNFRMWTENTWMGGYGTVMVLTLRYPPVDRPPLLSIVTNCSTQRFGATSGDADYNGSNNGSYNVRYSIVDNTTGAVVESGNMATPWGGIVSIISHSRSMTGVPGYDPAKTYTITVSTTGIAPTAGITGPRISAVGIYGPCSPPPPPPPVVTKPYFKANEGDVAAGANCADNTSPWYLASPIGTLTAWNDGVAGVANKGAGTNLAAFALAAIDQFASAKGSGSSSPPLDLTFANQSAGPWGGSFDGGIVCPTDYYGSPPPPTTPINGSSPVPNTNNAYLAGPGFQLSGGSPLSPGNRPIIYVVNQNVRIKGNVSLGGVASTVGSMTNFYLVVYGGNIYIDPGVSQLDGVYIAQPNGATGGKIYTCSDPASDGFPSTNQLNGGGGPNSCKNTLTVNGAMIAKSLKLYRSNGDYQTPGSPAAEIFNYTPAVWLAVPDSLRGSKSSGRYDAITSLPPIL